MSDHLSGQTEIHETNSNPILVEVVRGDLIETRHTGAVSVVNAKGKVIFSVGNTKDPVFPRSAIKPIQALMLLETGAAKAFGLGLAQIALACASHSGSETHREILANWLEKIGLSVEDLVCGPSLPWSDYEKKSLFESGHGPSKLLDNCSGKHLALLTVAKHLEYPTFGYHRLDHPVQQRLLGIVEQMTGLDLLPSPKGIDGCGIPVFAIPLENIALSMARLVEPHDQPDERQSACKRIIRAMFDEPYLIGGKGRFDTRILQACRGHAIVKTGAEGVYTASFPNLGLGVALKIDDGSRRAAEAAIMQVLRRFEVLTEKAMGQLLNILEPPLFSRSKEVVGVIRAAAPLRLE